MTLPEIPREALLAAHTAVAQRAFATRSSIDLAVSGAWPHLYAAALRHAMQNPGIDVACHDLLRCMAEAAAE